MKCADCGAEIEPGGELCFECGSPVRRTGASSSSYSTSTRSKAPASPTNAAPPTRAPVAPPAAAPTPGASSYDALIAEALRSIEEVSATPEPTPTPAPTPTPTAAPTAAAPSSFGRRPVAKRRAPIDDDIKVRCPGCGIPSTKERCPGCGTRLRPSDD